MPSPSQYAVYLRKSRKDMDAEKLGAGETLKRHETILLDLAHRQALPIGEIYREIVSGDSIDARPEMQRLLADVHQGRWKGVLVVELERLARGDTKDQGIVAEAFKYSETLIVTPSKTYDPNNEFDEEYFEFGLFMSRREYKTIKRRMQAGIKLSVLEGNYLSPVAPYGYDIVNLGRRNRTLAPNDRAPIVKMMFDWYADEKVSASEIARRLTDMHIPTPKGLGYWTAFTVTKILHSDIYIGKIHYGAYREYKEFDTDTGKVKTVTRKAPPEEVIIAQGKHPPLIDQATWDAAADRNSKNTRLRVNKELQNPLAGLLRCSQCGSAMHYKETVRPNKTYRRFKHRTDNSRRCACQSADYQEVMDALAFVLRQHIDDFTVKIASVNTAEVARQHADMVSEMKKNLEALQAKREKLFDYFENGIYSEAEFLERKANVNQEIESLSARIAATAGKKPVEIDYQEKIEKFSSALEALTSSTASAKEKNDLLKDILSQITYQRPTPQESFHLDVSIR